MGGNYKFADQEKLYFVSFSVVKWIDVFVRREYSDILVESFQYCIREKGLEIYAWCIMSSHVHLVMGTHGEAMQDILRDMKKFTSKRVIEAIAENQRESRREWLLYMFADAGQYNSNNKYFQLWQQDNHPIELYTPKVLQQKITYIHNNPVKADFVDVPEAYSVVQEIMQGKGDYWK